MVLYNSGPVLKVFIHRIHKSDISCASSRTTYYVFVESLSNKVHDFAMRMVLNKEHDLLVAGKDKTIWPWCISQHVNESTTDEKCELPHYWFRT